LSGITLLNGALQYYHRGWCVIPIPQGEKAARIRWKRYQTERPTSEQVQKWFVHNNCNIGVVLGSVSGGLCCRDFDTEQGYEDWAKQNHDLAGKLPTVKTANGYHVYFCSDFDSVKHFDDGELRGSGGYCLLPPSVHPSGVIYEWLIEPNGENLLSLDAVNTGLISNTCDVTENTEQTEKTEKTQENLGHKGIEEKKSNIYVGDFEKVIKNTLPENFGTRNRKVFNLARALRSVPEYFDATPKIFEPVVREWHKRALSYIRTKEFEETWIDFLKAWSKIKWKLGDSPMSETFEKAKMASFSDCAARYDNPKLHLLAAWCKELQRQVGDGSFFLSTRTVGRYLGENPMTAHRWLFLLEQDGVLAVVEKGKMTRSGGVATRFKYVAQGKISSKL